MPNIHLQRKGFIEVQVHYRSTLLVQKKKDKQKSLLIKCILKEKMLLKFKTCKYFMKNTENKF